LSITFNQANKHVLIYFLRFVASAKLGDDEICQETGSSKLEARLRAAERALQMLSVQVGIKERGFDHMFKLLPI